MVVVGEGVIVRFELLLVQFPKVLLCDKYTQAKQVWMLHRLPASRYFLDSCVETKASESTEEQL